MAHALDQIIMINGYVVDNIYYSCKPYCKTMSCKLVSGTNQAQLLKVACNKVLYVVTVTKHGLVRKSKHQLTSCEGNVK